MLISEENIGYEVDIVDVTLSKKIDIVGDLLIVIIPVYDNMPPKPFIDMLHNSNINYKYCVAIHTYGGVTYRNSLANLVALLSYKGMKCVAAAAVVTNHTYVTQNESTADKRDTLIKIMSAANNNICNNSNINIAKVIQHNLIKKILDNNHDKLFPQPHRDMSKCNNCGKCAAVCPANGSCINCLACVKACPNGAIEFNPNKLPIKGIKFMQYINKKDKII